MWGTFNVVAMPGVVVDEARRVFTGVAFELVRCPLLTVGDLQKRLPLIRLPSFVRCTNVKRRHATRRFDQTLLAVRRVIRLRHPVHFWLLLLVWLLFMQGGVAKLSCEKVKRSFHVRQIRDCQSSLMESSFQNGHKGLLGHSFYFLGRRLFNTFYIQGGCWQGWGNLFIGNLDRHVGRRNHNFDVEFGSGQLLVNNLVVVGRFLTWQG